MAQAIPSLHWQPESGCLKLPQELTILNLDGWVKAHKVLSLPVQCVDFAENQKMDSSVLALISHWAVASSQPISILHCPQQAHTLIELYDLQELVELN
ncbi:STAS domain-containing protein [Thiomicrorhabdus sp. 6S2-11]|uniref:STAS domain-containing protein n=1 Tax=Thiomicrorhabdus marina TaxID=2818442 RepID=A0ABS3Q1U7_9GAMM|nr:STAS domain-containing protein [Thiomicrorhabdus marina]MBO1926287.1 STAS domain-containing protein [Thiomicrorhabdus marina]